MSCGPWHVYPEGDLLDHEPLGIDCWCDPDVQDHGRLIVHNSFDERQTVFEEEEQAL